MRGGGGGRREEEEEEEEVVVGNIRATLMDGLTHLLICGAKKLEKYIQIIKHLS